MTDPKHRGESPWIEHATSLARHECGIGGVWEKCPACEPGLYTRIARHRAETTETERRRPR